MTVKGLLIPITIVLVFGIVVAVLGKWDWLLWGIVLLCPLMHLFGHNHSGHDHSKKHSKGCH